MKHTEELHHLCDRTDANIPSYKSKESFKYFCINCTSEWHTPMSAWYHANMTSVSDKNWKFGNRTFGEKNQKIVSMLLYALMQLIYFVCTTAIDNFLCTAAIVNFCLHYCNCQHLYEILLLKSIVCAIALETFLCIMAF